MATKEPPQNDKIPAINEKYLKDFSQEDYDNLKEAFNAIDADGNGTLDTEELQVFMNECSLEPEFTGLIMKIVDKSNDGLVDFDEFLNFIILLKAVEKDPSKLFKMLFDSIDANGDDQLDKDEIKLFVSYFSSGKTVSDQEIDSFLKEFSSAPNKDYIKYGDLEKILK